MATVLKLTFPPWDKQISFDIDCKRYIFQFQKHENVKTVHFNFNNI